MRFQLEIVFSGESDARLSYGHGETEKVCYFILGGVSNCRRKVSNERNNVMDGHEDAKGVTF